MISPPIFVTLSQDLGGCRRICFGKKNGKYLNEETRYGSQGYTSNEKLKNLNAGPYLENDHCDKACQSHYHPLDEVE